MPRFSDDDVTDYMVREAVVTRAKHERNKQIEDAKPAVQKMQEANQNHADHKEWAKEMGLVA